MSIAEKVEEKMVAIESFIDEDGCIVDVEAVKVLLDSLSMYWEHLSDVDKDFVEFVKDTLTFNNEG